jgi:hypothetical protein
MRVRRATLALLLVGLFLLLAGCGSGGGASGNGSTGASRSPSGPTTSTRARSRTPDLVMGAHDWIGNLVQNGAIDPLQLTDDTRAAFNQLAIKGVTYNGQVYGIPYAIENVVLFRNTDLAPEAPRSTSSMTTASMPCRTWT